ncbi:MAG: GGDEF domain-containing protein [Candidatus Limnocylindrales bacterium]
MDRLTGVANRQAVLAELFTEVERASRYERPLSVAFVDIDHFKTVNDTYGHAAGDAVLRGVARTMADNLRASDMIGRYGGEEFMLILTETGVDEGAILTEKLRASVQRQRYPIGGGQSISVTISIGVAGGSGQHLRMETLVRDADAAMYSAKSLGRNQTYIFAEPDDDARVPRAPISAAGRARAHADRRGRAPGRDGCPDLGPRTLAPLSEASLRRSSPRSSWRSPGSWICPLPRSIACAWRPCCTILARSRSRRTSWRSPAR